SEEYAEHLEVTNNLLHELGCEDKPIISVLNKCDLVPFMDDIPVIGKAVKISALNKRGLDELLETIAKTMPPTRMTVELLFPYNQGGLAAKVRADSVVLEEEYRADGVYLKAICDIQFLNKVQDYILPTSK
ncbi:MAG: GTPase HflX, partial [Clostridia bacterium]|nr:GTPase HflX [Clostridia bacterium]